MCTQRCSRACSVLLHVPIAPKIETSYRCLHGLLRFQLNLARDWLEAISERLMSLTNTRKFEQKEGKHTHTHTPTHPHTHPHPPLPELCVKRGHTHNIEFSIANPGTKMVASNVLLPTIRGHHHTPVLCPRLE